MQTLAKDFTVKTLREEPLPGTTPEQVLSGWLFYYDDWKREPMIRIRSAGARRLLEVGGRYARLSDFRNRVNEYRLEGAAGRPAGEADEKFNIIGMVCTGSMLRIFPYTDPRTACCAGRRRSTACRGSCLTGRRSLSAGR